MSSVDESSEYVFWGGVTLIVTGVGLSIHQVLASVLSHKHYERTWVFEYVQKGRMSFIAHLNVKFTLVLNALQIGLMVGAKRQEVLTLGSGLYPMAFGGYGRDKVAYSKVQAWVYAVFFVLEVS